MPISNLKWYYYAGDKNYVDLRGNQLIFHFFFSFSWKTNRKMACFLPLANFSVTSNKYNKYVLSRQTKRKQGINGNFVLRM